MSHVYVIDLPRLSIRDARNQLADVVDRAEHDRSTVITRRGKPAAAVVSIETLRRYLQLQERELNHIVDERMAENTERGPEDAPYGTVPLEDILREPFPVLNDYRTRVTPAAREQLRLIPERGPCGFWRTC